ncbi:MAG: LysM domain-containing protein [Gaiellales bacterium]
MARATTTPRLHDDSRRPRFSWSVWTFVAPVALAVCVLVIYTIAHQAGWLHRKHPARVSPTATHPSKAASSSGSSAAILYRPRAGDTLTAIAVRFGISLDQLHALNPKAPLTKALPSSPRIRLR